MQPSKLAPDYSTLFHAPDELAGNFVKYVESTFQKRGITWGVPSIDQDFIPLRPGKVLGLIGRPGHGKTTTLAYLARHTAQTIVREGVTDEVVVYAALEGSVEEMEAMFVTDKGLSATDIAWGKVSPEAAIALALSRPLLPIWSLGHSMFMPKGGKPIRMTVPHMFSALESMYGLYKKRPRLICLDYIQIVPVEKASERVEQVTEAIIRSKELAEMIPCALAYGIQASRAVDKKGEEQIPAPQDCQWSSAIEQVTDDLIGLWRPWVSHPDLAEISVKGLNRHFVNNTKLMIARLWKQRGGIPGATFALMLDPEFLTLGDLAEEEKKEDDRIEAEQTEIDLM